MAGDHRGLCDHHCAHLRLYLSPLTASRKILLAGLIATVIGIAADLLPRGSRAIVAGLALPPA